MKTLVLNEESLAADRSIAGSIPTSTITPWGIFKTTSTEKYK